MPIYEYKCKLCDHRFELMQSFSAGTKSVCPLCSGEATRVISLSGFVLKGTGWYVTDYPSKDRKKGSAAEKTSTHATVGSSTPSTTSGKDSSS